MPDWASERISFTHLLYKGKSNDENKEISDFSTYVMYRNLSFLHMTDLVSTDPYDLRYDDALKNDENHGNFAEYHENENVLKPMVIRTRMIDNDRQQCQ